LGAFKTQAEAAKYLGVTPRTIRRYREGIRTPRVDLARRMNTKVYRELSTKNVFIKRQVKFDDGQKFVTRTHLKLNIEELMEEAISVNNLIDQAKESGKEAGKRVTSVMTKAGYVKLLPD